jgi:hypothetical protein
MLLTHSLEAPAGFNRLSSEKPVSKFAFNFNFCTGATYIKGQLPYDAENVEQALELIATRVLFPRAQFSRWGHWLTVCTQRTRYTS